PRGVGRLPVPPLANGAGNVGLLASRARRRSTDGHHGTRTPRGRPDARTARVAPDTAVPPADRGVDRSPRRRQLTARSDVTPGRRSTAPGSTGVGRARALGARTHAG